MTDAAAGAIYNGFETEPDTTVSLWQDTNIVLPPESVEPGPYRTERTPYLREIADCLSTSDPTQEVCMMKGTQVGLTALANNFVGYIVDAAPGPILFVLPTVELARDHSRQKLSALIKATPTLRGKVPEQRSRDGTNTVLSKEFPGGSLVLAGSNSPANYRNKTIRYLILDDIDGFEDEVGDEGDPIALAYKRTDTYSYRKKILAGSTPTTKNVSKIERLFKSSDQRYYFVPCPHCGHMQRLQWGGRDADFGIRFRRDELGRLAAVWYECAGCHEPIDEAYKTAMLQAGEWRATYPERSRRGYHLSSLYSPLGWVSWRQVVDEFLEAHATRSRPLMKAWINTRLALTWEEKGTAVEHQKLMERAEAFEPLAVPDPALLVTVGVDTQDDRLVAMVCAWGPGEECWVIYYGTVYGDPAVDDTWNSIDDLLTRGYPHPSGIDLRIATLAVDTQGHRTQAVYSWARARAPRVIAIQGASKANQPIIGRPTLQDVNWRGDRVKAGVKLWPVGTDNAKATLYANLTKSTGPGCLHFYHSLPESFYKELTAEKLIDEIGRGGQIKQVWKKIRERNEAIDCWVYAYAAAYRAGLATLDFDRLRKRLLGGEQAGDPKPSHPQAASKRQQSQRPSTRGFSRPSWLNR